MLSPLRNRFGIPGVISVVALVFAMLGGAYAASNGGGEATVSAKAKRGPRGPRGATGPAGPAGPTGAAGARGETGAAGAPGAPGAAGASGKSVKLASEDPGPNCEEGGTRIEVEGSSAKKYVCNGKEGLEGPQGPEGPKGDDGDPWVAGQAPGNVILRGTWAIHTTAAAAGEKIPVALSTSIPVGHSLGAESYVVDLVPPGGPDPIEFVECTGSAESPTASPVSGVFCTYAATATNLQGWEFEDFFTNNQLSASGGGVVFFAKAKEAGPVDAYGSWVVRTTA
jgi:hypothetical protein